MNIFTLALGLPIALAACGSTSGLSSGATTNGPTSASSTGASTASAGPTSNGGAETGTRASSSGSTGEPQTGDTSSSGGRRGSTTGASTSSHGGGGSTGGGSGGQASPNCTTVEGSGGQIVDAAGDVWTVAVGVIQENGVADEGTKNVTELAYVAGRVYQENQSGGWWVWSGGSWVAVSNPTGVCAEGTGTTGSTAAGTTSGGTTAGGTGSSNGTLVQAPLSGDVEQGTWQSGDLPFSGLPSGLPFHYDYLLPQGYSTANTYPIIVYEHEDYEGTNWYTGTNSDPLQLVDWGDLEFDSFNTIYYRTNYPSIVLIPYADQSDGNGNQGNDQVINFGGYGDTPGSDPNEQAVVALVQYFEQSYSVDPNKVFATGDSLGGIGAWALAVDYNQINGLVGKVFTAFMPFAGMITRDSQSAGGQASQLSVVPVFAVSGAQDGTSPPPQWNEPLWQALAGNSNYPGPPNGAQAGSSTYWYLEDPSLGHDVWDTYRDFTTSAPLPMYDWLFSQGN